MSRNALSFVLAGLGLLGLASPPVRAAEVVEYYHLDAIGNVRAVTNQAGQLVERHDYLPFGEECTTGLCASNPGVGSGQPVKFTGKERDGETGLDYFGARYYRSGIARFTTVDPALRRTAAIIDPQRWNRYAYSKNNPLRFFDPDGRDTTVITMMQRVADVPGTGMRVGFAFHTALHVDNNGDPSIYDPSGGYLTEKKGSDAILSGDDADLGKYIKARNDQGETVETTRFKTTPEQEAKILEQAQARGDAGRPTGCATNVCQAVKDVGPFKQVSPTAFPARLRRQIEKLSGGETQIHEPPEPRDRGKDSKE